MSYSANLKPRQAPSDRSSRCPSRTATLKATVQMIRKEWDIDCTCKCSLIVSCAIGGETGGCRQRRAEGHCACRERMLPTCILKTSTPHGCEIWQEGHVCTCRQRLMPECLVTGCRRRQRGKRCQCPRTQMQLCPHLREEMRKHEKLTAPEAKKKNDRLAMLLKRLWPKNYADRRVASGPGQIARVGRAAVNVMMTRESRNQSLWHPGDLRWLEGDERAERVRRQIQGLQKLAVLICRKRGA